MKSHALILGGAGFIGNNIVKKFVENNWEVTVIDGFLGKTGGKRKNIQDVLKKINLIGKRIEDVSNLEGLIVGSDLVIDCMAWSCHREAILDPKYDFQLNVLSHLALLVKAERLVDKKIIFLGTESRLDPVDVQGSNKLVAEFLFELYSKMHSLNVLYLGFGNCFGKNQMLEGKDIGLIGGFIRDILSGKKVVIYGKERVRNLVYVDDLVEVVFRLSKKNFGGFNTYNLAGERVGIEHLVKKIIQIVGWGTYQLRKTPANFELVDRSQLILSDKKLQKYLGQIPKTELGEALFKTVQYFRENIL